MDPLFYILVFLGMLVEGEAVFFLAVYFAIQGYFNFYVMLPLLIAGVIVGDILWYKLGRKIECSSGRSRISSWVNWGLCQISEPFDRLLMEKPRRVIFFSKFTYGLNRASIVRAGTLKMSFGDFMKSDLVASFLWMAIIGAVAYVSATTFSVFKSYFKFAEIGFFGVIVGLMILFILARVIAHFQKKKFFNSNNQKKQQ